MVPAPVFILYRLMNLFLIAILASTVLFLPLYAIWVGIVTMQLNERYGNWSLARNTSGHYGAGAAGLELQGRSWDWDLRGWGYKPGPAGLVLGLVPGIQRWGFGHLGVLGSGPGAAGLGLELRVITSSALVGTWFGAGATGLQVWG